MTEVMMDSRPILEARDVQFLSQGKVREMYKLGDGQLLMIATDRISTFDIVHPTGIPDKGKVLAELSAYWMRHSRILDICANHFVLRVFDWFDAFRQAKHCPEISGRALVVKEAVERLDAECIARAHITGSAWQKYLKVDGPKYGATIAGVEYPPGLKESEALPEIVFTPTTKAKVGHDEDITWQMFVDAVGGEERAVQVKETTLQLFRAAREIAGEKGIIIADTKFEFGLGEQGDLMLIDEVLTPDSSRFWPAKGFKPGGPQPSFDKQYVRDYVTSIGWNKQPPAPELPAHVVATTADKYREILFLMTGQRLN
jgi:phosphoribosylaminoimidazole-succinocarboxamide synthase